MCNLREGFVIRREGFEEAPWRLREAFSKTRSAKASRSPLEGFAKASRRRHGRLHLETIRQIMTSPRTFTADHEQVWQPYAVDPYYSAISKWWPYLLALYINIDNQQ